MIAFGRIDECDAKPSRFVEHLPHVSVGLAPGYGSIKEGVDAVLCIGIEHKDLPKIGLCGTEQVQPVHLGARVGPLVGQDDALVEPAQLQRGDQSLPCLCAAVRQRGGLMKDVKGG